jgi:hypothetical protein
LTAASNPPSLGGACPQGKVVPVKVARVSLLTALMVLAVVLLPTPASAASTTETHDQDYTNLIFDSVDPSGCIQSRATVALANRSDKVPGGPAVASSTALILGVTRYDICSSTYLVNAQVFGVPIPSGMFQVEKKLSGATIHGSVEVCDFVTGACLPMNVSLTVTPAGETTTVHQVTRWNDGTTKYTYTTDQISQPASATGSITYGGFEYVQGEPIVGVLGTFKSRQVAVTT